MGESEVKGGCGVNLKRGLLVTAGLVVIVLLGADPRISNFRSKERRAQAKSMAMQLVNAVKQFHAEYGRFPAGLDARTPATSERALFAALAGTDAAANPKGIAFLPELKEVTDVYFGPGILRDASGLSLVDSWGRAYLVLVDDDGDGMVMNPEPDGKPALIPSTVLVWSGGMDGDPETWEDNLVVWKRE